jgi:anaerobic selenocysteine-containing dehydrogenase
MEKQKEAKRAKRREFLKLAGLGTLASAAAAGASAPREADAATPETATGSGYRETEHVRKAYALARF